MHPIKMPIYQAQQIREFEHIAQERFSMTAEVLMQRAGKAAFDFLQRRWPQAQKIAVFCGAGNNGGDGYVLAAYAKERGLDVSIWQVGSIEKMKEAAAAARQACQKAHIPIYIFDEKANLQHPDVIVDAICGIGVHENLREEIVAAIKKMERLHAPILSIDLPTGIDADTGQILGAAVHASATITFIGLKLGLLTGSGSSCTGELVFNDLQLPSELFSYIEPIAEKINLSTYATFLKPRPRDWHKGLSGHVLVIGGECGYAGAPRMAAEAALRVGAGLVTVATRPENALMLNIACPEIMCHGISQAKELDALISRASVIVLGPGLGQTEWSQQIWEYICQQDLSRDLAQNLTHNLSQNASQNAALDLPIVLDADGLNLLAKRAKHAKLGELEQQNCFKENWVLTPHPGEAARLIEISSQEVQQDRLSALKEINKRYGGVCVLKGAGSLVLAPNALPVLCDKGNPGMASAGMGDVLSGVIGGLLAQGIPLGDAAKLGVCIHAMAGDLAAKEGERGMMAMDLMPYLRRLSNYLPAS
jgi:hydroxyethylthiazole kinase-like uncharacterized protein yjeF